jgi:hypothetical protein
MGSVGRYSPKLTQDQRDAVVRAVLDGWSASEVVAAAAAGELDGLKPFEISETACRDLRREAERNPLWLERVRRNGGSAVKQDEARAVAEASLAAAEEPDGQEAEEPEEPTEPDVFEKRDRDEARERAYMERQIERILAMDEPTAKDLHTLKTARDRIETLNKRAARRAPQASRAEPEEPELTPLERKLLAEDGQKPRVSLLSRRHYMGMRWVGAGLRVARAKDPGYSVVGKSGLELEQGGIDRPREYDREWCALGGTRNAEEPPEDRYEALSELLDREEAALEALEARADELDGGERPAA